MKINIIFRYLFLIIISAFCYANGHSEKLYSDLRWEVNGIYYTTDVEVQSESEVTEVYVCNTEANPDEPGTSPKSKYSGEITIPSHIEISGRKVPVTQIAIDAFLQSEVKTVVIPNTIVKLGAYSFAGSEIAKIDFPSSLRLISWNAFENTKQLKYVDIPATVKSVESQAFYESGVKRVNCLSPDVWSDTFRKCENLISITLSDELTEISNGMFMDCIKLKNIVIPDKVEKIGESSFYHTGGYDGMESIVLGKSVQIFDLDVFQYTTIREKFVCRSSSPPRIERCHTSMSHAREGTGFTETTLTGCTLYVPSGSINSYRNNMDWGKFEYITEFETSGVESVEDDNLQLPTDYYNLEGVKVATVAPGKTPVGLPGGVYITRCGSRTAKMVVR